MFTAEPLIIELFPVLVVIPFVLTFLGLNILKRRTPNQQTSSWITKRFRLLLLGPYVLLYILMLSIGIIGYVFDLDQLIPVFRIFLSLFQGSITLGMGFVAGLIVAGAYDSLGVSGFVASALLLSSIPLTMIYSGIAYTAINVGLDFIDSFFIMILIFSSCQGRLEMRILRIELPTGRAKSTIFQRISVDYIQETARKLKSRINQDSDFVAREILHGFQETEGELGVFIREVLDKGLSHLPDTDYPEKVATSRRFSLTEVMLKPRGPWTLTEYGFRRRVKRNRILYFIFLIPILVLLSVSLSNLGENQWALLFSSGIIVISFPLALTDRQFISRRMNVEEGIKAAIRPLLGLELEMPQDDIPDEVSIETFDNDFVFEEIPADLSLKYATFLKRVNKRKDDPFLEKETALFGISGRILSVAISYLDVREMGIEDVGSVIYPRPPRQLAFLNFSGVFGVKYVLERLAKHTLIKTDPLIDKEVMEFNKNMLRPVAFVLIIVTAIMSLSTFLLSLISNQFWVWLVVLIVIADVAFIPYVGWLYWKLKQQPDQEAMSLASEESRVTKILEILREEGTSPLRLLMARYHEGLFYTGRTYSTTKGIQLKEAVFLPPVSIDRN
ncbi:MAG: hypothetical protein ACXADH_18075 [Candidatus Kariarchaeaceae archaeon]